MLRHLSPLIVALFFVSASCSKSASSTAIEGPQVKTLAGKSVPALVDGQGEKAGFHYPQGIAIDPSGNIFVADQRNNAIRKLDAQGNVTTFAGASQEGLVDGSGTSARFYYPASITASANGDLYVGDYQNSVVRKVTASRSVSTFAGLVNGSGLLVSPSGIAVDGSGNVFVTDYMRRVIRKIEPSGNISWWAGSGSTLHADGVGLAAGFVSPCGLAFDQVGNLYVADAEGHRIRKIAPDLTVTTFAGTGVAGYADGEGDRAQFRLPQNIAVDRQGNLFVTDYGNNRIRKITPAGVVSTYAGNGSAYLVDGPALEASFAQPVGIAVANDGRVYVSEIGSHRIRVIIP